MTELLIAPIELQETINFSGRKIAIASMHQKNRVLAPILEKELGLIPFVPKINTNQFGTFSGEIDRRYSPLDAALMKCNLAMDISRCDMAIASEGSFGPHPYIFFAKANEELILLVDRKNNLTFSAKVLSTNTNHDGLKASRPEEVAEFAEKIGFPEHGIILKDTEENFSMIQKDINSRIHLDKFVNDWFLKNDQIWVETDLRAMRNPTRMKVIKEATTKLIDKINSKCPSCSFPGFWVVESISGLKCAQCGSSTQSTLAHRYACKECKFESIKEFPNKRFVEDPMYCDQCNP